MTYHWVIHRLLSCRIVGGAFCEMSSKISVYRNYNHWNGLSHETNYLGWLH